MSKYKENWYNPSHRLNRQSPRNFICGEESQGCTRLAKLHLQQDQIEHIDAARKVSG